jgi:hypothetical protein
MYECKVTAYLSLLNVSFLAAPKSVSSGTAEYRPTSSALLSIGADAMHRYIQWCKKK